MNPSEATEYLGITSRETLGVNTQGSLSRTCQLGMNSRPYCSSSHSRVPGSREHTWRAGRLHRPMLLLSPWKGRGAEVGAGGGEPLEGKW